jgi:hypothetical protein
LPDATEPPVGKTEPACAAGSSAPSTSVVASVTMVKRSARRKAMTDLVRLERRNVSQAERSARTQVPNARGAPTRSKAGVGEPVTFYSSCMVRPRQSSVDGDAVCMLFVKAV